MSDPFDGLPRGHFGVILADPPWHFQVWAGAVWRTRIDGSRHKVSRKAPHYDTMTEEEIASLTVSDLAAENCVLFLWTCWPVIRQAFRVIDFWGFTYKTCGFSWTKAHIKQIELFRDDVDPYMGLGYWTRSNTEPCLLATRGKPKRLNGDVAQAIISPRREHSRKPDCVHERIERLVAGPYLELFARQSRPGWTTWGNETTKFDRPDISLCAP
jgi:N6-adenosine-specific RNA methylase IME4